MPCASGAMVWKSLACFRNTNVRSIALPSHSMHQGTGQQIYIPGSACLPIVLQLQTEFSHGQAGTETGLAPNGAEKSLQCVPFEKPVLGVLLRKKNCSAKFSCQALSAI